MLWDESIFILTTSLSNLTEHIERDLRPWFFSFVNTRTCRIHPAHYLIYALSFLALWLYIFNQGLTSCPTIKSLSARWDLLYVSRSCMAFFNLVSRYSLSLVKSVSWVNFYSYKIRWISFNKIKYRVCELAA